MKTEEEVLKEFEDWVINSMYRFESNWNKTLLRAGWLEAFRRYGKKEE
jgi:hypothetical protein